MHRQIIEAFSGKHPVYGANLKIIERVQIGHFDRLVSVSPDSSNTKTIEISDTNYLSYTKIDLKNDNLYFLKSLLISFGSWEALIRGVPFVIVEEYCVKKSIKDSIAKTLMLPFRGIPFIANTKRTRDFLKDQGIRTIYIPPGKKMIKKNEDRSHILFVGRAVQSKNPLFFARLAELMPGEEFVFIGKGELAPEIERLSRELHNLEYIPYVESREELMDYYARAKLLIHPPSRDPIGFVIVEALSAGTPVLASSGAGASDFLPKEWVMEGLDEKEWVARVKGIAGNLTESVALARKTFEQEHLDIEDPYFEKAAAELETILKRKWPHLFEKTAIE